jgi:hypothetical protein
MILKNVMKKKELFILGTRKQGHRAIRTKYKRRNQYFKIKKIITNHWNLSYKILLVKHYFTFY